MITEWIVYTERDQAMARYCLLRLTGRIVRDEKAYRKPRKR